MSSVTFSTSVGGDGSTVTDDDNATTGLGNGGALIRLVPMMQQVVNVASYVVSVGGGASDDATAAAASAAAASSSATAAAASYDSFDDRYLGSKTSDPSVDNDGNALLTGAIYWNSSSSVMKVWSGSAWVNPNPAAGYLALSGGTMTGAITFASNQFGTNVNTFLTTPSSANLAAALTDETGTGVNVFNNTPTLIAPILGTPTSGDLSNCTNAVGYGLKSATTTVSVSAATAPTAGQVLMATSSTAATWQSPGGSSALVLLATVTASAATTVNFRNSFSSTYDTYLILCNNLSMSTSASLGMQFAVAGTADANAIYGWQRLQSYNNSFNPYAAGGQTSYQVGDVITTSSNSTIAVTISGVNSTLRGKVCSSNYGNCGATGVNALIGQNIGVWGGASVASGVQFLHDGSATISGTFYLYGYAKS